MPATASMLTTIATSATPAVTATRLHALAAATTESELAESLLHESGDNVRHFWFI
jgi:hypothetical protein